VIRSVRRGEQCSTSFTARRLRANSDEWHRGAAGKRVYSTTMMIRQFTYPKVTPIRPGAGNGPKPGPAPAPGGRR
jgi:hypothetical protein